LPLFSSRCKGNLDRHTIVVVIVVELEFHVQTLLSLCQKETDVRDNLDPSISYLRKLSPQYINQVFESSRETLEVDCRMALEVIFLCIIVRLVADNHIPRYSRLMTWIPLERK
jgi:hypothetical protein